MTDTLKNLFQSQPSAGTLTDAWTATAATALSTIQVCNTGTAPTTFRISHAVAGAADGAKQYLYYGEPLPANKAFAITLGLAVASTDVVRVYSGNGLVAFQAWGVEVT